MTMIKNLFGLAVIISLIFLTAMFIVSQNQKAFGEVNPADVTTATSTPQLVDMTNLCPQVNPLAASSTTGTLDFITINAPLVGDLLIMDATTTNSALRLPPAATSSKVLLWLPSGYGTSTTIKMGVEFKRGLLVDYGTTASTTIGYRCER